jgi:multiple sugar transport system substrate-binding protein
MSKQDTKKEKRSQSNDGFSRRDFLKFSGAAGAGAALLTACQARETPTAEEPAEEQEEPTEEVSMPYEGTTIRALLNDFPYQHYVVSRLDEFTEETGIEVEHEIVAWPVLLEQTEVELSSGSDTYDILIQIFIKAQRFMRAGWSYALDDFIAQDNYDLGDYLAPTRDAMNWEGKQYGIPFLAESTQMLYRKDKLEEAGLDVPQTFEELAAALEAIHNPPDFHAYVMRTEPNGVHFPFPIWLQGYGGNVFRNPPDDLTPTLNTPEALQAAENFTQLILDYSIAGQQTYATPDCQNAMAQGLAGIWVDALGIMPPTRDPEQSQVADQLEITLPPAGPEGRFPQIASHGYQIPKASNNKEAAWEFIKWATSPEMFLGSALEGGYFALPRESVLTSEEYGEEYGNIGEIIAEAVNLAKVDYRVVPEFPEVGQRMGQGIAEIISGQKSVEDAMNDVQEDVEQIMITAGREIDTD